MPTYLLDTNHLAPALNRVSRMRDRILQACKKGDRFATCWPVLCELEAGIVNTKSPQRNRRTLTTLMEKIAIWPQEWEIARQYGQISKVLSQRGRVLSAVDITLLAFAVEENAILLTTDLTRWSQGSLSAGKAHRRGAGTRHVESREIAAGGRHPRRASEAKF